MDRRAVPHSIGSVSIDLAFTVVFVAALVLRTAVTGGGPGVT